MYGQLSFLQDLDRASDTRKANLCRTWKNALKNDCGVFIENSMDFEAHEGKKNTERFKTDGKCDK